MRALKSAQSGAALVIGLIFLVLLAIVGLSSMRNVTLQEQITGNTIEGFRAQHTAEVDLLTAEENIKLSTSDARTRFLNTANNGVNYADSAVWADCGNDAQIVDNLCEIQASGGEAKYETTPDDDIYIITIKSNANTNGGASVMLQSTYEGRIEEQD